MFTGVGGERVVVRLIAAGKMVLEATSNQGHISVLNRNARIEDRGIMPWLSMT